MLDKRKRIEKCMLESNERLNKYTKLYNDSIKSLKIEIEENKELGNPVSANMCKVNRTNEYKTRVKELKDHMQNLNNMLNIFN